MDKYVENLTERQAEVELTVERESDEIKDLYDVLLQDISKRSEMIFDSFVLSYITNVFGDVGPDATKEITKSVSVYMDMTFDELNTIPVLDRSEFWRVASSAMVTAAQKQAEIMSGFTKQSIKNGIENAKDLQKAIDSMTVEELKEVQVDIKGTLKRKKDEKRNANPN